MFFKLHWVYCTQDIISVTKKPEKKEREKMRMDISLEALYSAQIAQTSQTSATQTTQTQTDSGESFADLLAALSGTGSSTNQMQQYLMSGLMDGSINVGDSGALVSALLGTLDGEDGTGSLLNFDTLSGDATSGLSSDILKSLLDLGQSTETDWLAQILEAFSASETDEAEEETDTTLQEYYQAQAAMVQAQMNLQSGLLAE